MSKQTEELYDLWNGKYQFGVDEEGVVRRILSVRFNNAGKLEYSLLEGWFCKNYFDGTNYDDEIIVGLNAEVAKSLFKHYGLTITNTTTKVSDLDNNWVELARWERKP